MGEPLGIFGSGFGVLENLGGVPAVVDDVEHIPLAIVVAPPTQVFDGILIEAQDGCVLYFLGSIFFTPKFADPDQTCVLEHLQLTRFYPSSSPSPVGGPELWFNGSTM